MFKMLYGGFINFPELKDQILNSKNFDDLIEVVK